MATVERTDGPSVLWLHRRPLVVVDAQGASSKGDLMRSNGAVDSSATGDLDPRRLLAMAVIFMCFYLAMPLMVPEAKVQPWLLASALIGSVVAGVAVATIQSKRVGADQGRSTRSPAATAARIGMMGLIGISLILAQSLSMVGVGWLVIGGAALATGAAAHGWMRKRRNR
ncbi:hypothetical protein [Nocardioides zhouii]|uniref:Uncharacterized protein n=1 Tax=Nocardioides zhouii TaxID=1168729 RepID=A0A4V1RQL6_9ACTN|nr:hypothetical protein [Nocardioides zhouii]RYC13287.1 hypothetical protein EUA94_05270 [Nocardioides zhouii]